MKRSLIDFPRVSAAYTAALHREARFFDLSGRTLGAPGNGVARALFVNSHPNNAVILLQINQPGKTATAVPRTGNP